MGAEGLGWINDIDGRFKCDFPVSHQIGLAVGGRDIDLPALRTTFGSLVTAFCKRELWVVGLFLFLYYFNPGLNMPLYYHMTDNLKFSQGYIGIYRLDRGRRLD